MVAEIDPAADHRGLVTSALDNQQRDIGTAAPQLIGDPGESVDPFLDGRIDVDDIPGTTLIRTDLAGIDEVGKGHALDSQRPAVVLG